MAVGFPDWQKSVAPVRAAIGSNQQRFEWFELTSLNPLTFSEADIYTVPAGNTLFITAIWISANGSVITPYYIERDGSYIFFRRYDINDILPLNGDSAIVYLTGERVGRLISNDSDTYIIAFSFNIVGYLVDS